LRLRRRRFTPVACAKVVLSHDCVCRVSVEHVSGPAKMNSKRRPESIALESSSNSAFHAAKRGCPSPSYLFRSTFADSQFSG
jgi:hypothetical protein